MKIALIFVFSVAVAVFPATAYAESPAKRLMPITSFSINPAGELETYYRILPDGYSVMEERAVILVDREPKTCGDPGGSGKTTWFFTDAYLIPVEPDAVRFCVDIDPESHKCRKWRRK